MKENKQAISLRVTPQAKEMLVKLAEVSGLSQASVIETLIRQEAKKKLRLEGN